MTHAILRRALPAVLAVGLAACADQKQETPEPAGVGEVEPGSIVVDFKDGTQKSDFDTWEKDWGIDLEFNSDQDTHEAITVATGVRDVEGTLAKIRARPEVESAEPNFVYHASFLPDDPGYARQWNLKLIDAEGAWDRTRGKGVTVAVIDTGIAYENKGDFILVPDLDGAKFAKGYDFVNDTEDPYDDHGHGTHVAGTIAQVTNNGKGVAGVAFEATLMPIKVLDHFGSGTASDIAEAIRWAADHGAQVINLSLGGGARSAVMESAVKYARKKGVTVVCAAGNTGMGTVQFPAAYPGAVAVSAIGPDGRLAPYSSFGSELDLAAPGGNKALGEQGGILQNTLDPRDGTHAIYASYQGTSMAAPHVSGVAALLYSAGARGPDEVEAALFKGAKRADGQGGWDERFGHGVLNAKGALEALGGPLGVNWRPLLAALALLVGVLLTLRRRQRPGYFNVLFKPTFLLPLVLATVGFFFLRWFGGVVSQSEVANALTIPIPDLDRIIFGRRAVANPLFYSALIPTVASVIAVRAKSLRPLIAGLSLGFGGFLAYAAFARAPALAYLPFSFLAVPWLVVNALVCLLITRAMLKKDVPA